MKTQDMQKASQLAQMLESTSVFEAVDIQSITVQANLFFRSDSNGRSPAVAIRVDPTDPRFAALEQMLRSEAASKKAEATQGLTDLGITPEVSTEVVTRAQAESVQAKAQHLELLERNRQKRLLAEALAAEQAAKAGA